MKILGMICVLGTLAASSLALGAVRAADVRDDEAVRRWLSGMTPPDNVPTSLAARTERSGRISNLETVSIEEIAAPPEVKAALLRNIQLKASGPQMVPTGDLPSVASYLGRTSHSLLAEDVIRNRLLVAPSTISKTPLRDARLLSSSWAGTSIGGKFTGLSRIFVLQGTGLVEFNEVDYQSGSATVTQIAEALNDSVAGTPATSFMQRSKDGRGMASLTWRTPSKSYELRLFSDEGESVEKHLRLLRKIAEGVE